MLVIKNLTKSFGGYKAVNNLNLNIKKGEIFGFVGPNGAGKTTTMKMISSLLKPDNGEIIIDGYDISKDSIEARKKIGYMPDFFGVYDNLKVTEYMEFFSDLAKIPLADRDQLINDLLDLVNLLEHKCKFVDSLSRGMKQRLCLARALIHNPELIILDEPASGMDPKSRLQLKEILKELKNMGKTVIVSSHILPELAEICTTVGIMNKGKLVVGGTIAEISNNIHGSLKIKVKYLNDDINVENIIKEYPRVKKISSSEKNVTVLFEGDEFDVSDFNKYLVESGVRVILFNSSSDSLEELFVKATEGGIPNEK